MKSKCWSPRVATRSLPFLIFYSSTIAWEWDDSISIGSIAECQINAIVAQRMLIKYQVGVHWLKEQISTSMFEETVATMIVISLARDNLTRQQQIEGKTKWTMINIRWSRLTSHNQRSPLGFFAISFIYHCDLLRKVLGERVRACEKERESKTACTVMMMMMMVMLVLKKVVSTGKKTQENNISTVKAGERERNRKR